MSVPVADLVQLTLRRLHEATASTVGQMATGTGGAPPVTATDGIIEALNRVAAEVCRTCYYYEAEGSITQTARTIPLSALTGVTPADATLWAPLYVNYPGGALEHMRSGVLSNSQAFSDTLGVPEYWLSGGEGIVFIYPSPNASYEFVARGAALPPVMVDGGADVDFMSDELLQKLLPAGAASRLAMTEADSPALAERGPLWQAEYDVERGLLWDRMEYQPRVRLYPSRP